MVAWREISRGPRQFAVGWGSRARYFVPTPLPIDYDADTVDTIRTVRRFTMTGPARLRALIGATEYVVQRGVPGAFVECGVWRGGSMMAVAETLLRLGSTDRELVLCDTFAGMTPPSEADADSAYDGYSLTWMSRNREEWNGVSEERVRSAMDRTGYPSSMIRTVKGQVEETLPDAAPEAIALLRLDTDFYESTRHEMEHLFPRLQPGGVLILDDYGHYEGARRAVDEYLADHGIHLLLNRIDYTGRIAVKPG